MLQQEKNIAILNHCLPRSAIKDFKSRSLVMDTKNKNRYFIELQMGADADVPRHREAAVRRAQAALFIDQLAQWLHEKELNAKVTSMAITALGQVQITCEQDIIAYLRSNDNLPIAAIRQSATLAESVSRIGGR
jgi:hypothetical protein